MLKIRASSLGKIMTEPKSKSEVLSVGAKTYIEDLAKQFVYGFEKVVTSKEMEKGIIVEGQSIDLLNTVLFTSYEKNTERRNNDWITGECDIFTGSAIHDIKSSWSLSTFPATVFAGRDRDYEWQLRAYMWLWGVDRSEIDYCLVTTPDELIGYESETLHYVDHIAPELRVTRVPYERDKALEDQMKRKVDAAREYFDQITEQIALEHAA